MENFEGRIQSKQKFEFIGKPIFYYDDFDIMEPGSIQFKDVDFVANHMHKYNGEFCVVDISGNVTVYSKLGELLCETYVTEIFN